MPIVKRSVSPVNVSSHRLAPSIKKDELECVANGTLANLIRQLSSLSKQAEQIFSDIYHETVKIDHKASTLTQRVDKLKGKIDNYEGNDEQDALQDTQYRKPFKSSNLIDQQTFDRQTLPIALQDLYNKCEPPPNLDALNEFRDDPKPALKYYTDPGYFFDLWKKQILKECEEMPKRKTMKGISESPEKKIKKKYTEINDSVTRYDSEFSMPIYGTYKPPKILPSKVNHHQQHFQSMSSTTNLRNNDSRNPNFVQFPEEYQAPRALQQTSRDNDSFPAPPPGMSLQYNNIFTPSSQFLDTNQSNLPPPLFTSDSPNSLEQTLHNFKLTDTINEEEEDELPPPPNVMITSSLLAQIPSLPKLDLVPTESSSVPPPPPPPPPPMGTIKIQPLQQQSGSFASDRKNCENNDNESGVKENNPPCSRSNLLAEIQSGIKLKKVQRKEEKEAEKAAVDDTNDVAAILRRRMEHVLGHDDSSESNEENEDDDWD
uniref:Wiskott-Aldrich syndrome protein family member n=1 Tax=Parastrongyloides trichosuri TaxID=131310 RepID=A0A0N5A4W7_PARTI